MRLSYPSNAPTEVKNTALKYAYTYIVQKLLTQRHNEEGAKRDSGEITRAEWDAFLANWWTPRHDTVTDDLLELRAQCFAYAEQYKEAISLEEIPI